MVIGIFKGSEVQKMVVYTQLRIAIETLVHLCAFFISPHSLLMVRRTGSIIAKVCPMRVTIEHFDKLAHSVKANPEHRATFSSANERQAAGFIRYLTKGYA